MPGVTATTSWVTMGAALTEAESWQAHGNSIHVTVDTPANALDSAVYYHVLDTRESITFPAGKTISYRASVAALRISRQPVA